MTSSPGLRGCSCLQPRRGVLQTTTDAREQNNTAPHTLRVGGPVKMTVSDQSQYFMKKALRQYQLHNGVGYTG